LNIEKRKRLLEDPVIKKRVSLIKQLLVTIPGIDLAEDGLKDTPLRIAAVYDELYSGYQEDPEQVLRDALFTNDYSKDLVVVKDIPFFSLCEHHNLSFFGKAAIAYIPQSGTIVGLSKLARMVDIYARRLQVQEKLTRQILSTFTKVMAPYGAAVMITAEHLCMTQRGVAAIGTTTTTSALDGIFLIDDKARNEVLMALKGD
jgi:GTP cyclohydrolase I